MTNIILNSTIILKEYKEYDFDKAIKHSLSQGVLPLLVECDINRQAEIERGNFNPFQKYFENPTKEQIEGGYQRCLEIIGNDPEARQMLLKVIEDKGYSFLLLDEKKVNLILQAKDAYKAKINADFELEGATYQADKDSLANMQQEVTLLTINPALENVDWVDKDNQHHYLKRDSFIDLVNKILQRNELAFQDLQKTKEAIKSAKTLKALEKITI